MSNSLVSSTNPDATLSVRRASADLAAAKERFNKGPSYAGALLIAQRRRELDLAVANARSKITRIK